MKKTIYYLSPFIIYPILLVVLDCIFDKIKYITWSPIIFIVIVSLASLIISLFSKNKNKIDILIACCILVAYFVTMVILVLIEVKSDDHYRFTIETFYQPLYLLSYLMIFISGLAASYEKFRLKISK